MRILIAIVLAAGAGSALAQVQVQGHLRKDGTYVMPHYRSAPDNTQQNNYSTQGNVNPFTGQPGTIQPAPKYDQPTYQPMKPQPAPSYQDYTKPPEQHAPQQRSSTYQQPKAQW
jgi:hypothetical protein